MIGITRGISTLIGAGIAGFLIWLATQMGSDTAGGYWATYGLIAAAGVTMALSQILGGWTKWGWPRLTTGVFVLAFLPALLTGGWVLLARQPAQFFNTSNWSRDLGIDGAVGDLGEVLGALAFGIGLILGLTFDTAGPRRQTVAATPPVERDVPEPVAVPVAADPPPVVEPIAPAEPVEPAEPVDEWGDDEPNPPAESERDPR